MFYFVYFFYLSGANLAMEWLKVRRLITFLYLMKLLQLLLIGELLAYRRRK